MSLLRKKTPLAVLGFSSFLKLHISENPRDFIERKDFSNYFSTKNNQAKMSSDMPEGWFAYQTDDGQVISFSFIG
jgi:hypothetical protein